MLRSGLRAQGLYIDGLRGTLRHPRRPKSAGGGAAFDYTGYGLAFAYDPSINGGANTADVSALNDLSGNGRNLAVEASGDPFMQNVSGGIAYLTRKTTASRLVNTSFTIPQPFTVLIALRVLTAVSDERILRPGASATDQTLYVYSGGGASLKAFAGAEALITGSGTGVDQLFTVVGNGASGSLQIDSGTATTGNIGAQTLKGVGLGGGGSFGGNTLDCRIYGVFGIAATTMPAAIVARAFALQGR